MLGDWEYNARNERRTKKNTLYKSKLKQIWIQFDIIDKNFIESSLKIAYNVDLFRCLKKFNWTACICSAWEFKCQKFNFLGNCFFPLLLLSIKVFDIITKSWNKRTVSIQFKGIQFRAHSNHRHLFVRDLNITFKQARLICLYFYYFFNVFTF